jgi:Protein of unknown function (DUF3137)
VDTFVPMLAVMAVAAGIVALVYHTYQSNQKRMRELQQFCLNRGWTYVASAPQLVGRWQQKPFDEGDNRKALNVLAGTWQGRSFTAFDYSFDVESHDSTGGSRARTTSQFGVVALRLPAYLPHLQVTQEGMVRRFAASVGLGQDIQLESEDFNRAFTVSSTDPKFASDILNPRTMQMLLASTHLAWRIEGADVLCCDAGYYSPVDVLQRLDHLTKIVEGVPSFVWHDHGYDPVQAAGGGAA